jgi:hypothetical protein
LPGAVRSGGIRASGLWLVPGPRRGPSALADGGRFCKSALRLPRWFAARGVHRCVRCSHARARRAIALFWPRRWRSNGTHDTVAPRTAAQKSWLHQMSVALVVNANLLWLMSPHSTTWQALRPGFRHSLLWPVRGSAAEAMATSPCCWWRAHRVACARPWRCWVILSGRYCVWMWCFVEGVRRCDGFGYWLTMQLVYSHWIVLTVPLVLFAL